jgi:undecaprenyl-diphosphatase
MRAATHLGSAPASIGIALLLSLGAVDGLQAAGRRAAWALAVSHLVVQTLKRTVRRPRPEPRRRRVAAAPPDPFSFPSGHTAAAFSIALSLAPALGAPWAAGVLALATLTAFSRVYLGVHYPADVAVGAALAAAATAAFPFA